MIAPGRHGEHMAELVKLRREVKGLEFTVGRVRELHQPDMYGYCEGCLHKVGWPECPTVAALDRAQSVLDELEKQRTTTDEGGESDLVQGR